MRDVQLAVVGLGYWGPNLLRNAWEIEGAEVALICDADLEALTRQARRYQSAAVTTSIDDVIESPDIDGVILATPISTHFELAHRALSAGKHVMVEKPMAGTTAECRELADLATESKLILMPGHAFLYSPPVQAIRRLLDAGDLGDIHFVTSSRVNLGIHQRSMNVIRDLGPHDFSMLLHWFGTPEYVRAIGRDAIVPGSVDVAFVDVGYANGCLAHIELSWLAPTKLRRTVIVGSRKMVIYEDTSAEQVRVFDRGVDSIDPQSFGEFHLSYRSGDVLTPRLDAGEPLKLELEDFVHCIQENVQPRSHAGLGTEVVRMIEAAESSLRYGGLRINLDGDPQDRRIQPDRRGQRLEPARVGRVAVTG